MTYNIAEGDLPPGDAIKCGNRTDLFRKQRVHQWQELGEDIRNGFARGFVTGIVSACSRCGLDKFERYTDGTRPQTSSDPVRLRH